MPATIVLPRRIAEKLRQEAEKQGASPEELVIEAVLGNLDPPERAREYIEAAEEQLAQAEQELEKGDIRQAAEKLWGAAALAIKAYASWRDGKRLTSHSELWMYKNKAKRELGKWVSDAWAQANTMHTCFYGGWCSEEYIRDALERVKKLVRKVKARIIED